MVATNRTQRTGWSYSRSELISENFDLNQTSAIVVQLLEHLAGNWYKFELLGAKRTTLMCEGLRWSYIHIWENMTAVFFSFMKSNVPHRHHMVLHSQFLSQEDGKRLFAEVVLSGHIVDGDSSCEDDVAPGGLETYTPHFSPPDFQFKVDFS